MRVGTPITAMPSGVLLALPTPALPPLPPIAAVGQPGRPRPHMPGAAPRDHARQASGVVGSGPPGGAASGRRRLGRRGADLAKGSLPQPHQPYHIGPHDRLGHIVRLVVAVRSLVVLACMATHHEDTKTRRFRRLSRSWLAALHPASGQIEACRVRQAQRVSASPPSPAFDPRGLSRCDEVRTAEGLPFGTRYHAPGIRDCGTAMRWPRACLVTGRAWFGAPGNAGGPAQAA